MSNATLDWFASAAEQGVHIHVEHSSRDCDGRYERTCTITPGEYGDTDQQTTVRDLWKELIGNNLPWNGQIEVEVNDGGATATITESTDEGYSNYTLILCDADDVAKPTYRDFTAEKAGY